MTLASALQLLLVLALMGAAVYYVFMREKGKKPVRDLIESAKDRIEKK